MIKYILEDEDHNDDDDESEDLKKSQERSNFLDDIFDEFGDESGDKEKDEIDLVDDELFTSEADTEIKSKESQPDAAQPDDDEFDIDNLDDDELSDEDYDDYDEEIPQKSQKTRRTIETHRSIKPLLIKLEKLDNKPIHINKINRFSELLKSHGIDINNYEPELIDWSEWTDEDIKEHNTILSSIKFYSADWSNTASLKEVDPYAMSQINFNLWPDISVTLMKKGNKVETTLKSAAAELLFGAKIDPKTNKPEIDEDGEIVGNPNEWAKADKDTPEEYKNLQRIYAASREFYRKNYDKTSQLANMDFLNEYNEVNSVTLTPKSSISVGLWRVKGTDQYIPLAFSETEKLQKEARKKGQREISITREIKDANGKTKTVTIPVEPVLTDIAKIEPRMSFAPRSGRRAHGNEGWSKSQLVGGLNNAIVNLFSGSPFVNNDKDRINWSVVAKLQQPIDEYIRLTRTSMGTYLHGWDDDALLKLTRMFSSVLPSNKRLEDMNKNLRRERETATTSEERRKIEDQINKNQERIDRPSCPNRGEWETNFNIGYEYPSRVASSSFNQLLAPLADIDNVYLYKHEHNGSIIEAPLKYEEGYGDYRYLGPAENVIQLGIVGKLKEIQNIIKLTRKEMKEEQNQDLTTNEPDEFVEEGIITSPATIIINGNPFKLHYGDKLLIDNVKI